MTTEVPVSAVVDPADVELETTLRPRRCPSSSARPGCVSS